MRISDWSSDVCSSDLEDVRGLIDIVDVHRDRGAAVRAVIVLAADAADADRRRCHAAEIRCDAHAGDLRRQILEVRDTIVGKLLRSEEHTSELQSLMRISYAVF